MCILLGVCPDCFVRSLHFFWAAFDIPLHRSQTYCQWILGSLPERLIVTWYRNSKAPRAFSVLVVPVKTVAVRVKYLPILVMEMTQPGATRCPWLTRAMGAFDAPWCHVVESNFGMRQSLQATAIRGRYQPILIAATLAVNLSLYVSPSGGRGPVPFEGIIVEIFWLLILWTMGHLIIGILGEKPLNPLAQTVLWFALYSKTYNVFCNVCLLYCTQTCTFSTQNMNVHATYIYNRYWYIHSGQCDN